MQCPWVLSLSEESCGALPRAADSELRRGGTNAASTGARAAAAGGGPRSITRTDARSPIEARVHVISAYFLSTPSFFGGASARSSQVAFVGSPPSGPSALLSSPPLDSVLRQEKTDK